MPYPSSIIFVTVTRDVLILYALGYTGCDTAHFASVYALFDREGGNLGWRLISQFPPFRYFTNFQHREYTFYLLNIMFIFDLSDQTTLAKRLMTCRDIWHSPLSTHRGRDKMAVILYTTFLNTFFNTNHYILIEISLNFIFKGPISIRPTFFQKMA